MRYLPGGSRLVREDESPIDTLPILARLIRVEPATGDLIIENGAARIVLQRDGAVRVEGVRIVNDADETIALRAAVIELN